MRKAFAVSLVMAIAVMSADAAVRMPGFFNDDMVLQRGRDVPVWGWADKGEVVTVEFAGQKVSVKAGDDGTWKVMLKSMKASSESRVLLISASNRIEIKNVVVGDVWICSGQSNMEWAVRQSANPGQEAQAAKYPLIRHIKFNHSHGADIRDDIRGDWTPCNPGTAPHFTAVGYYFGRELHKELNVPIGLIGSNWGGTRVEPWVHAAAFGKVPQLKGIADHLAKTDPATEAGKKFYIERLRILRDWTEKAEKVVEAGKHPSSPPAVTPRAGHQDPTMIYNHMINPIVGYGVRGAIWYQGESNGNEGESYFQKKTALINGWRELWGYDFPFYFVQLADFQAANDNPAGGDGWAKIREAQRKTLTIDKTGMAVIIDIGDASDIHPKNKQDVGKRLARWALANEFGKDIVPSGPLYKDMTVKGNKAVISFDYVGSGLMVGEKKGLEPTKEVKGGKLQRFAVAGDDKVWVWADAVIEGNNVIVSSPKVEKPAAVRYAFSMNPAGCNLYNKEGVPASPFRTDSW